jgi:uncharacterized damage-inducible protein DinB
VTVSIELVKAMYGHSQWTNNQLLQAAEELSSEELHQPVAGASGSTLDILVHMMGAQMAWTRRFKQLDPVKPPDAADYSGIPELRAAWAEIDDVTNAYIDTLSDEDLAEVIHFRSWAGWEGESPRWQAVLHQAFHQHQHRGEVAAALTAFGHSPGEIDIFDYLEDPTYQVRPRA